MSTPSRRRPRRVPLPVALPVVLASAWCTLLQPRAWSPLAPLLGPWAGHLLGHGECTLARAWPAVSIALAALGPGLALGWWRSAAGLGRGTWLALLFAWTVAWCGLAVLSVGNASA